MNLTMLIVILLLLCSVTYFYKSFLNKLKADSPFKTREQPVSVMKINFIFSLSGWFLLSSLLLLPFSIDIYFMTDWFWFWAVMGFGFSVRARFMVQNVYPAEFRSWLIATCSFAVASWVGFQ